MLSADDIEQLEWMVVTSGLAIGLALGWISRFSGFCTLGAVNDWRSSGDTSRLRMWLLAMAVAIVVTQGMQLAGLINTKESFYVASRVMWASNLVGGLIFGFGMVLASGCGGRTLVRIGGGSLKAMVVFLVMAIFAYMAMRGVFGVLRVATIERIYVTLPSSQDLPSVVGMDRGLIVAIIVLTIAGFVFSARTFRQQPRLMAGGIVIGLLVAAGWYATGHIGFIEEDPNTLEARFLATNTRSIESLTFVAPLAYWLDLLMFWSDASRSLTFSIAAVTGVSVGALVHALASGSFRWEGFVDRQDLARHMTGAAMMGVGGVVAFGCTIGQGISGISLMALGSLITTVAIVAGAWMGLAWVERRA